MALLERQEDYPDNISAVNGSWLDSGGGSVVTGTSDIGDINSDDGNEVASPSNPAFTSFLSLDFPTPDDPETGDDWQVEVGWRKTNAGGRQIDGRLALECDGVLHSFVDFTDIGGTEQVDTATFNGVSYTDLSTVVVRVAGKDASGSGTSRRLFVDYVKVSLLPAPNASVTDDLDVSVSSSESSTGEATASDDLDVVATAGDGDVDLTGSATASDDLDVSATESVQQGSAITATDNVDLSVTSSVLAGVLLTASDDIDVSLGGSPDLVGTQALSDGLDLSVTETATVQAIMVAADGLDVSLTETELSEQALAYSDTLDVTLGATGTQSTNDPPVEPSGEIEKDVLLRKYYWLMRKVQRLV